MKELPVKPTTEPRFKVREKVRFTSRSIRQCIYSLKYLHPDVNPHLANDSIIGTITNVWFNESYANDFPEDAPFYRYEILVAEEDTCMLDDIPEFTAWEYEILGKAE